MAYHYQFLVSLDGKEWKKVIADGEFSNIMHNPLPQTVALPYPESARFIKIEATTPDASPALIKTEEIGVTILP
mgnify:FL=1